MASEIILKALPFDSREIVNPDTGIIEYDRVAYSADFAKWMATYFSNGVLVPNGAVISDEMEVVAASEALTVIVKPGAVLINGRTGWVDRAEPLTVDVGGAANRIDRIVAELNIPNDRQIALKVVKGTTSPPPLIRTDDIYQLSLAQVEVRAGQAVIHSIYDERSDDVCGVSNVLIGVRQPERPKGNANLNILPYEEAETAIYPHAVGDHIMLDGEYFIVTSPIAAGNSIVEGVNITRDYVNNQIIRAFNSVKQHHIEYIKSSGIWTVPSGVTNIELYLVGGGGGAGVNDSGKGGKILYLAGFPVTPNSNITVTIGAGGTGGALSADGGETIFGSLSTGGYYACQDASLSRPGSAAHGTDRTTLVWNNSFLQICPIDGKAYGIGGASGGGYTKNQTGGTGGDVNIPLLGIYKSGGANSGVVPGAGASADEVGYSDRGGHGAPNTGSGGGGGTAYPYGTSVQIPGGNGGSGIVVIGYYK